MVHHLLVFWGVIENGRKIFFVFLSGRFCFFLMIPCKTIKLCKCKSLNSPDGNYVTK